MSSSQGSPPPAVGRPRETGSPGSSDAIYHLAREWVGEDIERDEDASGDMDYEPSSGRSEFESLEDIENLSDGRIEVQSEFSANGSTEDSEGQGTETEGDYGVDAAQLINAFGGHGVLQILQSHGLLNLNPSDDGDTGDIELFSSFRPRRRRRRTRPAEDLFPKVPSDVGTGLMASGTYGNNQYFVDRLKQRNKKLYTQLLSREIDSGPRGALSRAGRAVSQDLIPGSVADKIIHYDTRCYSGQFSDDGNFFFSCAQDFKVRMYDTSNPHDWKYYKTVDYPFGRWTITDATLSPDNRYLAYSSIHHVVCLAETDPASESEPLFLDFARGRRRRGNIGHFGGQSEFGIWSIRFSGDGREIIAGTSDGSVLVYDIEKRETVLRLQNHGDEVNAVCFGDSSSPHILYSGSDDTTLRVWDRRSMGDGREAGVFMGHTEGLTYVDSKGDGRYVLSNGKDQTMKLWDLRKMMTTAKFDTITPSAYTTGFDYRYMDFSEVDYQSHPHDCSVVTYRGHSVLKTLIRCHFSPPESTNSRYVYTGSEDGKVYVYNLDATLAGVIDVAKSSLNSRPRDAEMFTSSYLARGRGDVEWNTCVRDASWHPNAPIVAATSWNGWDRSTGTCTLHSWGDDASDDEGDPPVSRSYDDELESMDSFNRYADAMRQDGLVNLGDGGASRGQATRTRGRARRGAQVWESIT